MHYEQHYNHLSATLQSSQSPVGTRGRQEYVLRIPMRVVKGDENGVWPLNYGAVDLTVAFG